MTVGPSNNQFKNLLTPDSHQDNIIMAGIFGTEQREKLEKTILSYPSIDNALSFLEKKTQVKKVYILYGIITFYFENYNRIILFKYGLSYEF